MTPTHRYTLPVYTVTMRWHSCYWKLDQTQMPGKLLRRLPPLTTHNILFFLPYVCNHHVLGILLFAFFLLLLRLSLCSASFSVLLISLMAPSLFSTSAMLSAGLHWIVQLRVAGPEWYSYSLMLRQTWNPWTLIMYESTHTCTHTRYMTLHYTTLLVLKIVHVIKSIATPCIFNN